MSLYTVGRRWAGDELPQRGAPQTLKGPLPVALLEEHLPAEGEVEAQQRVADIHKDGVQDLGRGKVHV